MSVSLTYSTVSISKFGLFVSIKNLFLSFSGCFLAERSTWSGYWIFRRSTFCFSMRPPIFSLVPRLSVVLGFYTANILPSAPAFCDRVILPGGWYRSEFGNHDRLSLSPTVSMVVYPRSAGAWTVAGSPIFSDLSLLYVFKFFLSPLLVAWMGKLYWPWGRCLSCWCLMVKLLNRLFFFNWLSISSSCARLNWYCFVCWSSLS